MEKTRKKQVGRDGQLGDWNGKQCALAAYDPHQLNPGQAVTQYLLLPLHESQMSWMMVGAPILSSMNGDN